MATSTSVPFNPRAAAARVIERVVAGRRYMDEALAETLGTYPTRDEHRSALLQEMVYGTLRWWHQLAGVASLLLTKALKPKDLDVYALLLVGLYQLRYMRIAPHAAVMETVAAVEALGKVWAKGLLNACLRASQRRAAEIEETIARSPSLQYSHPPWMIERFKHDHPDSWPAVLTANNQHPPMVLRANRLKTSRATYLHRLEAQGIMATPLSSTDEGVQLSKPCPVTALPGFTTGEVSVQDGAAQLVASLLDPQPGERILDACAAPGGKTAHLLERCPDLNELVALDIASERLLRIQENLGRLGLSARLITGDAGEPGSWWDGRAFDRILLDVPCSATGVIRRHPDIKVRRRPEDIAKLTAAQARILERVWPLLKHGGKLLYVTCSLISDENDTQMIAFLARHPDAREIGLHLPCGTPRRTGYLILPGEQDMDGFYYACVQKN